MPIAKITKNSYTIDSLYQWDLNQVLQIYGLSLATTPEIHFANPTMELAIVRKATMDNAGVISVDVPNSLLQKSQKINAYICIIEGESFKSLYKLVIPVIGRAKPSDYQGEDEIEVYSLDALGVEMVILEPTAEATIEKILMGDKWLLRFSIPRGNDGNDGKDGVGIQSIKQTKTSTEDNGDNEITVTLTNGNTAKFTVKNGSKGSTGDKGATGKGFTILGYKNSLSVLEAEVTNPEAGDSYGVGTAAPYDIYTYDPVKGWVNNGALQGAQGEPGNNGEDGKDGVTFTPKLDDEGNLSWTNDGGLENPPTVNIKGSDGNPGQDGDPGADGVGIKSVVQTTTSTADGGENVITVTLTNNTTMTFKVKNGSKGSDGAAGKDGADGKTPVKGTDYFTAADKSEMVAQVNTLMSAANTDYSTVRARGIAIVADEAVSVPNGCLCGVYSTS